MKLVLYQTQSHALTTQCKVNDDDTNLRGKEYKYEKVIVYIVNASGVPGVPTLGTHMSRDVPKSWVM